MIKMTVNRDKVKALIISTMSEYQVRYPEKTTFNPLTTTGYIDSFLRIDGLSSKMWDAHFLPEEGWEGAVDEMLGEGDPELDKSGIRKAQKEMAWHLSLKRQDLIENYASAVSDMTGADTHYVIGSLFELLDQAERVGMSVSAINEKDVQLPTYLLNMDDSHDMTM